MIVFKIYLYKSLNQTINNYSFNNRYKLDQLKEMSTLKVNFWTSDSKSYNLEIAGAETTAKLKQMMSQETGIKKENI